MGPKEGSQRPPPCTQGQPHGQARRQTGARTLSEHASRARFERERDSRPQILLRPSPTTRFSRGIGAGGGSHSPISILVVDIEPLRGAKELWGSEQRCQGACTHLDPGSLLPTTWLPLTSRSAEKHLSHGLPSCLVPVGPPPQPISWRVLIARSCRSSGLASLGPQPHLFIVEGGGDGPPPTPGLLCPQRTGPRASAWLAFLPEWAEERVSLFHGPRGLREKREGPEA